MFIIRSNKPNKINTDAESVFVTQINFFHIKVTLSRYTLQNDRIYVTKNDRSNILLIPDAVWNVSCLELFKSQASVFKQNE